MTMTQVVHSPKDSAWKLVVRLLLAMLLVGCQRTPLPDAGNNLNATPSLKPLPQDAFVEAYFNQSQVSQYTESYRQQVRFGDDLEQKILETIASAKSSVIVAVQELRSPKIAWALSERHKAGVQVRVIIENTYARPWSSFTPSEVEKMSKRDRGRYREGLKLIDLNDNGQVEPAEAGQRDALIILKNFKVPLIDDTADGSRGSDLMHHKFVVVDDRTIIVTSANFTTSDLHGDFANPASRGNANNLLRIDSRELATAFTEEFNLMWGDGPGRDFNSKFGIKKPARPAKTIVLGNTRLTIKFSPTSSKVPWAESSNGLIGQTLSTASQSTDMALFVFSEQRLADVLEQRHQQGVQVRALIDPQFAYRPYSDGLDMLGVELSNKCKVSPGNRPWSNAITTVGVPRLPPGDLLHHKFGVVDGKTVITGSHNWSAAANTGNDETVLIVESETVAAHFKREFDRLYQQATLGVPPALARKIQQDKAKCTQST